MSRIQKKSPLQRLSNYQTFLTDNDPNSRYFKLSEIPDNLTSGKNAFLIEGTPFLKPTTDVKIEVLDAEGNPLYVEPGEGIPEYYEGLSKLISIHVYENTPIGIGKITILGEVQTYIDENGVERYVPGEWEGVYNVKWEKEIKINKNVPNETRVRFLKRPTIIIEETGESFYSKNVSNASQTDGTVRGLTMTPAEGTDLSTWGGGVKYLIQNESADFVNNGKTITVSGTSIQNADILEYLNQRSVIVQVANTSSANIVKNFTSSNYSLNYEYISSIAESSIFGSFARFEINNLATFVGDAERLKVYAKSRASSADYYLLHDTKINSTNLLTDVISGSIENLGYFTSSYSNGKPYTYYWNTQSSANISLDSNAIYKAVKFQNNKVSTNLGDNIRLEKDSEYTVQFYTYYSGSSINALDTLKVYISSTLRSVPGTSNFRLTQSIATLNGATLYKNPQKLSYNFIPDSTDDWTLNFEAVNPNADTYWHVGSVILEGSNELGYSPDEFTFTVPITRELERETFDFRFEYYDINNNYVPIIDTATQTFVSGNITLLGKNLAVDSDKYFFTFEENSNASPASQTISINANKTKLAGNLLITSQAFDSGGFYIPDASFLGTSYPGKLTSTYEDLVLFTGSLTVANFTGSLHNVPPGPGSVIVDRILYTFTEANSTQPQVRRLSVSRVLTNAGTGSQGAAGQNAKTVNLVSNIYSIPYNSDGGEIGINNVWLTASQQNHLGTVYYEFLKNDVTKQNSTSQFYYVSQSEKPNTGSRDSWKVNTREGTSGSSIVAFDTIDIFGLKDGVSGYTIFFTNGATSFPADENGIVSSTALASGITDVIFIRGTSSFNYDQTSPYDNNTYRTGSVTASANISYSSSIVNNGLRITPTAINTLGGTALTGSIIIPFIDNYTSIPFNIAYTYSVSKAGISGSNAVSIIIDPTSQTITYKPDANVFANVSKFNVRVLETGSALYYTSSVSNLTTGSFTILLSAGNGTNNSINNITSGSITPPQPNTTAGTTSSFAIVYVDSKGRISQAVSASHNVSVVSDGLSGSNAVNIVYSPVNQVVSKSAAGGYKSPVTFSIQLFETGSALRYTGSGNVLQNGYFTIYLPANNGTLVPGTASLSASIIPPTVTTDDGVTSSFAIQYRDSIGRLSQYISQSYYVYVVTDGQNGASGSDARVVSLTSDNYIFTYNGDSVLTPTAQTASLTASAQNVNVAYYEFLKNGISKQNTTSNYYIITGSEIPQVGITDLWQVNLRSGSAGSTILAFDNIDVFGLRAGSDSYTVFLTNEAHTFASDDQGNVPASNLAAGQTEARFLRGTASFSYNQTAPYGLNTYSTGSITASVNIQYSSSIINNNIVFTPTSVNGTSQLSGSLIIPLIDNATTASFIKTYTFGISKAGSSGSNAIDIVLDSPNQTVTYKINNNTFTGVNPFFIRVRETGSFLSYTTSNPPTQNSTFTIALPAGNGTNNSIDAAISGSITPPQPNSTNTTTSSFAIIYKDSKGLISNYISASHYVNVVTDGTSGSNAVDIVLDSPNQTITYKINNNTFTSVVPFFVRVKETGSFLSYTTSNPPTQNSTFTILLGAGSNGTNNSTNASLSGSVTPPQPNATTGTTSSFAVLYKDSKGVLSNYISASHYVGVVTDGTSGSNAISVILDATNQNVTYRSNQATFTSTVPFFVRVKETGSFLSYTTSNPPTQNSTFTVVLAAGNNGTNNSTVSALSASITPPTPTATSGTTSSFSIIYRDSKGVLSQYISQSHYVAVVSDGLSGSNAVTLIVNPTNQNVSKSIAGTYSSPVTFSIQLFETGSALRYTGSNNVLQNSYFTIYLPGGAGALVPATGSFSASIIPPTVVSDSGATSSFAIQYRDSKGVLSQFITASHYVSVIRDGATGASGSNALTILINPSNQTVTKSIANTYARPISFSIQVFETGSALRYSGSNVIPLQNGYFSIYLSGNNGSVTPITASFSASILPPLVTLDSGTTSSFAVQYRDSKGNLSSAISQSHVVSVVADGQTGPGIVVTGPWKAGFLYQYDTTTGTGRRDVIFETSSKFYFATLQQHVSSTPTAPPTTATNNTYWQFLGSQSLFVAAEMAVFQESFVSNTLNIGSNNNGRVSSANITLAGSGSFPYISIGQSSSTGSQGYGVGSGIFIGRDDVDGAYKASFETSSGQFLKWDGAQLLISGNISASAGNIGGWTIDKNTLTSTNTSMSINSSNQSINMFSGSGRDTTISIAPGSLTAFGATSRNITITEIAGLGSGTTYSTVNTFNITGASSSIAVSAAQTGSYAGNYGPAVSVASYLVPSAGGFQGIANLTLYLQIGTGSNFSQGTISSYAIASAQINSPGTTTTTAVALDPVPTTSQLIETRFANASTYFARLLLQLVITNRTLGSVYIAATNTNTPTPLTLTRTDASFTEIGDGGLQVVYNSLRYVKIPRTNTGVIMDVGGDITTSGTITAGTKPFRITHPLDDNKWLMHLAIEGPRADLIYRGITYLISGSANVNMDEISKMTPGTWEALNRDTQFFLQNMNGWDRVKGELSGSNLHIVSENTSSSDLISYMVVGERKDRFMYQTNITDAEGRLITEYNK